MPAVPARVIVTILGGSTLVVAAIGAGFIVADRMGDEPRQPDPVMVAQAATLTACDDAQVTDLGTLLVVMDQTDVACRTQLVAALAVLGFTEAEYDTEVAQQTDVRTVRNGWVLSVADDPTRYAVKVQAAG